MPIKLIRICMGGLILGINTLYMLSCFLKQFALGTVVTTFPGLELRYDWHSARTSSMGWSTPYPMAVSDVLYGVAGKTRWLVPQQLCVQMRVGSGWNDHRAVRGGGELEEREPENDVRTIVRTALCLSIHYWKVHTSFQEPLPLSFLASTSCDQKWLVEE